MEYVQLEKFIGVHREDLIRRCRAKVTTRAVPPSTEAEINRGIPMFLDQLVKELQNGSSQAAEMCETAVQHGQDLLFQGFTVGQVVHDYGDVCQSITDLAVETRAPISPEDFRTLNRCLDDAIAGAVTEFARGQTATRDGNSQELRNLSDTAIAAFEALQTGNVGIGGSTGGVVHRSLLAIRAYADRAPGRG